MNGPTLSEAVEKLAQYGSDSDPITYKGGHTTPRDLVQDIDKHQPAKDIRIDYFRDNRWILNGTITGMLADRMKLN